MAVIGSGNFLGQMRIDVPHLRAIESSVCNDFDVLAGVMMGGKKPLVLSGFTIPTANSIGAPAESLSLVVENGLIIHYFATDSGSIMSVPSGSMPETLSSVNTKVNGSFIANGTNYIGLDLLREVDETSVDLTQFLDADTNQEFSEIIPTRRVFSYEILISGQPFSANKNIVPIAIVETDSLNNVLSITDARSMMFRLGSGGDSPFARNTYPWGNRTENPVTFIGGGDSFLGEDKSIDSLKSWMDSMMTSIWELRGGNAWYSSNNRDNVKLLYGTPVLGSNGDNFNLIGNTISWSGLRVAFENSPASFNTIQNNSTGVTLISGQCLYVDIIREGPDGTTIVPVVANLNTLGASAIPGRRFIIAWRIGVTAYTRDRPYEIGRALPVATVSTLGISRLSGTPGNPSSPIVSALNVASYAMAAGLTRSGLTAGSGALTIGNTVSDTSVVIGASTNNTTVSSANFYAPNLDRSSAASLVVGGVNQNLLQLGRIGAPTSVRGSTISIGGGTASGIAIDASSTVSIGDGINTFLRANTTDVLVDHPLVTTGDVTIGGNYKYTVAKTYPVHFGVEDFIKDQNFSSGSPNDPSNDPYFTKNITGPAHTSIKLRLPPGAVVDSSGIGVLVSSSDPASRTVLYNATSKAYNSSGNYTTSYLTTGGLGFVQGFVVTSGAPSWKTLNLTLSSNVVPADGFFRIYFQVPTTTGINQINFYAVKVVYTLQTIAPVN